MVIRINPELPACLILTDWTVWLLASLSRYKGIAPATFNRIYRPVWRARILSVRAGGTATFNQPEQCPDKNDNAAN